VKTTEFSLVYALYIFIIMMHFNTIKYAIKYAGLLQSFSPLNPAPPLFECNTNISKSNQELMKIPTLINFFLSLSIICYTQDLMQPLLVVFVVIFILLFFYFLFFYFSSVY